MKKYAFMILPILLMAVIFSGCEHETITQNPGEYRYQINEPINIVDVETGDTLGVLTVTGVYTINDKPFTVRTETGTAEDGEPVYEDIAYEQLLQVNYIFENAPQNDKTISGLNFSPYAQSNDTTVDPKTGFDKAPLNQGESCFTVAFSQKVDQFELHFRYGVFQLRKTAVIHISLSNGSAAPSPSVSESSSIISPPQISDSSSNSPSVSLSDSSPSSSEDSNVLSTPDNSASDSADQSVNSSEPHTQFWLSYLLPYEYLLLIAALLLEAVIVLTVVLIAKRKKK